MVNIEEIYKNISEYDITKENVIKSLFKGSKEDTSHFYYRSMILQLLKNSGHLDEIITLYYKNERGFNYGKWVNINIDGKVVKKSKSDLFKEAKQRIHILYSQFEMGRYEELEKILDWATKISSSFSVACHNNDKFGYIKDWFDETLMNLIIEFDNIELDIHSKMGIIRRNEEQKKKEEEEISKQRTLTVTRKNKTHVRTIKHRFFLKFFHFLQNQQRNKENEELEIECSLSKDKKEKVLEELKNRFSSMGIENLYEELFSRYEYYNEEISMYDIMFQIVDGLAEIKKYLSKFLDDVFICAKNIQNLKSVLEEIKNGATLEQVCNVIRTDLNKYDKKIELGIRNENLDNRGFLCNSPSKEELPKELKELEAEYKKIMMEEDIEKFIRGCARLHFNFLRIHPFLDGNGRTARILLSTMLASRNIFFPSVYIDREGKEDFYIASNAALTGRYERTEQDLLSRIGHFYPMVLPQNKGENMER